MPSRREAILGGFGVAASLAPSWARADSFDVLLKQIVSSPDLIEAAKAEREGQTIEYELRSDRDFEDQVRAYAPRLKDTHRQISHGAQDLIIAFEVTDARTYVQRYRKPTWPKGDSGVTIGIGYDLGYIKLDWLKEDWSDFLSPQVIQTLGAACGLRGADAGDYCRRNGDVLVPWDVANAQFSRILLPRFVAETLINLPQAACLNPGCLGALVSLVYNRGASFTKAGPRYLEMREIRTAALQSDWQAVPDLIEGMARLWADNPAMRGLVLRRKAEAAEFRLGLGGGGCRG